MFEAYKVFVKIKLVNEVSAGLMSMSGHFSRLNKQADVLNAKLKTLKTIGFIGAGISAGGIFGLVGMTKSLSAAEEYTHQLNIMNIAGMKHKSIVEATAAAWRTATKVPGTTPTSNLKTILDLRNVLGTEPLAKQALPYAARLQMILGAVSGKNIDPDQIAFSMAKALDIIGATKNSATFKREANLMTQVVAATQGRVSPYMFQQTFAYARQARYGLNDQFKYGILPSLMLEYSSKGGGGGGSRGVGPGLAAIYRLTNQGYIAKASLPILESLGLVAKGTALHTTTTGTTVGAMKGSALAAANPFEWVQQVLAPAIYKKYGHNLNKQQILSIVNQVARGNQLAASLLDEFMIKPYAFYRDERLMGQGMTGKQAYAAALSHDPHTAFRALSSAWETLKIAFGMSVVPVIIPAILKLANDFNELANVMRRHQAVVKAAFIGLAAIFTSMALLGGIIALGAALFSLSLIASPLGMTIVALTAALAGLAKIVVDLYRIIRPDNPARAALESKMAKSSPATLWAGRTALFASRIAQYGAFGFNISGINHELASLIFPVARGNPNLSSPDYAQHEAQPSQSSSQGAIYLDAHEVGSFFFGHGMNQHFYQQQLGALNRFNASLSPSVPDAVYPH